MPRVSLWLSTCKPSPTDMLSLCAAMYCSSCWKLPLYLPEVGMFAMHYSALMLIRIQHGFGVTYVVDGVILSVLT